MKKEKVFFRKLRAQADGNTKVIYGLTQIMGLNKRFAQAVVSQLGIDPEKRIGEISDEKLIKIEEVILNPIEYGIPNWMVNRKNDPRDGDEKHLTGNQLEITVRRDIVRMKKIKSFKGQKHRKGLKVRASRFKEGRLVGVKRSKIDKDIAKLSALMQERSVDRLTLDRQYLPEIINKKLLEFGPSCSMKPEVEEYFKENGLNVNYDGIFITFFKKVNKENGV